MRLGLITLGLAAALAVSSPAIACAIVLPANYEGSALQQRNVRDAVSNAMAIIDGEVIRPYSDTQNALVRVAHVYRGNVPSVIEVGYADSCAIALEQSGGKMRMILSAGPQVYQLYRDQSEARLEDRILKSDRRKIWPYVEGRAATNK